jgi:hypothetical protein
MDTALAAIDPRNYNLTGRDAEALVERELGVRFTPQKQARLRWAGRSPPCLKKLGRFYFEKEALLAWARSQLCLIAHDDGHRGRVK